MLLGLYIHNVHTEVQQHSRGCIYAYICADECREGCIINGQIIPAVCLAEAVDFKTMGGLLAN